MKLMDEAEGAGAKGRWVYDEQQDVTTTASDESEADLGQMNSFIYRHRLDILNIGNDVDDKVDDPQQE